MKNLEVIVKRAFRWPICTFRTFFNYITESSFRASTKNYWNLSQNKIWPPRRPSKIDTTDFLSCGVSSTAFSGIMFARCKRRRESRITTGKSWAQYLTTLLKQGTMFYYTAMLYKHVCLYTYGGEAQRRSKFFHEILWDCVGNLLQDRSLCSFSYLHRCISYSRKAFVQVFQLNCDLWESTS